MSEKKGPNLVWILSDQHRFCDAGYAGNREVETENLNRLSEIGANFISAYSNCPLCVPARGSALTGLHALRHGAAANDLPIRPDCESIADVLNSAGYHTAYIGKWHLHGAPRNAFVPHYNRLGFQYWRANNCNHDYLHGYYDDNNNMRHSLEGYAPAGETDLALKYLEQYGKGEIPFAMFVNYGTPHDPYFLLPEGELERYASRKLTLRGNCEQTLEPGEMGMTKYDPQLFYAGYYAHIRQLDIQIGRIWEKLDKSGQLENTVFVYSSDHGDMIGSHGYLNKQLYFEESAHIPLLISWPGHIPAGKRRCAVSLVDLAPTVLGIMGLGFRGDIDGEDLSRIAIDPQADRERFVYFYSYVPCHQAAGREVQSWRAITDGKVMLAVDENRLVLGLYHMETDPLQQNDLKEDPVYNDLKEQLLKMLDRQVDACDGYIEWEELLRRHELSEQWKESEIFFADFFSRLRNKTPKGHN